MERQKKIVKKTRVIKVSSEESWDCYVTKAFKQGCPVSPSLTFHIYTLSSMFGEFSNVEMNVIQGIKVEMMLIWNNIAGCSAF